MVLLSLLALLVLGGGAIVLALVVFALANKRFGIAALVVGLAFVALLFGSAFLWYFAAATSRDVAATEAPVWAGGPINDAAHAAANGLQEFTYSDGGEVRPISSSNTSVRISFFGLFLGGLILALIVMAVRRVMSPSSACNRPRLWPFVFAVPVLLLLVVLGLFRVRMESSQAAVRSQIETMQHDIQHQRDAAAKRIATLNTDLQNRIGKTEIHKLMDQSDAPRVVLPPQPTAVPAVPNSPFIEGPPAKLAEAASESDDAGTKVAKTEKTETTAETEKADSKPAATPKKDDSKPADAPRSASKSDVPTPDKADSKPAKKTKTKKPASSDHKESIVVAAETPSQTPAAAPPAWIATPPKRVGETWRAVLATDEYATVEECNREADRLLLGATFEHLQVLIGNPDQNGRHTVTPAVVIDGYGRIHWTEMQPVITYLARLGITIGYVRGQIAKDEYMATTERSVGPMKKLYTLVEFSPAVDRELLQRWSAMERQNRFAMVSVGAGSILGLLGLAFGLLKFDTWTKGYYTKWLFLGVPAAIIGGVLLLLLIDMSH